MMLYSRRRNIIRETGRLHGWILVILLLIPLFDYGQEEVVQMPFVTIENHTQTTEKVFREKLLPLPAGHTVRMQENITTKGIWDKTGKSFKWRIGFYVPGAYGLNVYLNDLKLRKEDKLFIYTFSNKPETVYTETDNGPFFGVGFLKGDSLVIELQTRHQEVPFKITEIGIAEKPAGTNGRDFGGAGGCEVLVNCEEGEHWQAEKNGVARILVKESTNLFWCTGSLVNNTNTDGKPYFLTANHCGEYASVLDYSLWMFYFNYEGEDCEFPMTEPSDSHRLMGAKLLAHSSNDVDQAADFKLLLLKRDIPDNFTVFYNGWDRSGTASSSGVTIHHPQGDIKMISTYKEPVVSTEYAGSEPDNNGLYWKVKWAETTNGYGVTEGGSSGSPLFNAEGFIIGTLTGGEASCSYPEKPDYYGKLSFAWESEGEDSTSQLKYWLDPLNTGVLSLKGTDLDTNNTLANFSSDVLEITVGEQVQFTNYSSGNISGYEWYFEGGEPSYSEEETPPKVKYNTFGAYDVTLIAKSASGNDTLYRPAYIRVLPLMVPNPSADGVFRLSFGKEMPAGIEITVTDIYGKKISPVFVSEQNNSLYVDVAVHAAGIYLIHVKTEKDNRILKAFYLKR